MAEFHVDDQVFVILAGKPISGKITKVSMMSGSGGMERLYQLDNGSWWPESRLDYDLTAEQKTLLEEGERLTWELFAAAKDADKFWHKAKDGGVPPALLAAFRRKIQEIVSFFNKQTAA